MKTNQTFKRGALIAMSCLAFGFGEMNAQTFIPSTAYENIYAAGPPPGDLPTCYSFDYINFGGTPYGAYLSAVNDLVVWQLSAPGNPSSMLFQGTVPYTGCMDMNVGMNYDNSGTPIAVVAYYQIGVGHFYDVYKWTTGGLSLISSTQVSTLSNYTRISMDSHKTYGMVITWEDPNGIYAVAGLNGVFTAPIYLNGSGGMERPDVAFSHSNVGLNVHFVYDIANGMPGYDIYETEIDFWVLNASLGSATPTVMDVNSVLCYWSQMTASIDAPDHYAVDNWAYTYAVDGVDIFTRTMDFYSSATPVTTNIVDGLTFGNAAMPAKELRPRIAYNQSGKTYHVAWYSSYNIWPLFGQCYFSEEIYQDGLSLISAPDYELVANNSFFPPGASLNSIAFSKQNDASPYLYAVFLDNLGIHDSFHKWTNTSSFKQAPDKATIAIKDNCSSGNRSVGIKKNAPLTTSELSVGPNPFSADIHLYVPASLKDQNIKIQVSDITGKVLFQQEGQAASASSLIEESSKKFVPGTYLVNIKTEAGRQQNFKVIKTSGN